MVDWLAKVPSALQRRWWRWRGLRRLRQLGVDVGDGLTLYGLPIVSRVPDSSIRLGRQVALCSVSRYTALGVAHPVILRTLQPGAVLEIGDDVGMSGGSVCAALRVSIGRQCLIGADVQISDTDFHAVAPLHRRHEQRPERIGSAPVLIGENVFIGAGARILKGVCIGRDAVIGAGAVVTASVPDGAIAAGNPARVVGSVYARQSEPAPAGPNA